MTNMFISSTSTITVPWYNMIERTNNSRTESLVWSMVFNATFNNISVISWWSVVLVEETGIPGENHRLIASH
jgi:hypothetical protein